MANNSDFIVILTNESLCNYHIESHIFKEKCNLDFNSNTIKEITFKFAVKNQILELVSKIIKGDIIKYDNLEELSECLKILHALKFKKFNQFLNDAKEYLGYIVSEKNIDFVILKATGRRLEILQEIKNVYLILNSFDV